MNFLMALLASIDLEWDSLLGHAWYIYYRARFSILGDSMFDKVAPYAKFVVGLAGVVATVIIAVVAGPPAWAYVVVSVATALGVVTVPNSNLAASLVTVLKDAVLVLRDGVAVVQDVRTGDTAAIPAAVGVLVSEVGATAGAGSVVVADAEAAIVVPPVVPPVA